MAPFLAKATIPLTAHRCSSSWVPPFPLTGLGRWLCKSTELIKLREEPDKGGILVPTPEQCVQDTGRFYAGFPSVADAPATQEISIHCGERL